MHSSTKAYLKREIVKLIVQTNDIEHKNGQVTVCDIQDILNEMKP